MSKNIRGIACVIALTLGVGAVMASPVAAAAATGDQTIASLSIAPSLSPERGREVSRQSITCTTYVVQSGDWLSRIASRYGVSWQSLANANHLSNPNLIHPRQVLCITPGDASPPPASTPGAPPIPTQSSPASSVAGEFCHGGQLWAASISQWTVPPGCYAGVYTPNPRNYVARSGFGWCNWWPEVLHPDDPAILFHTRHSAPIVGAVVVFNPGDQGASAAGHYAEVVAIGSGGWLLISEMNDTWRGAGFGRVNYRYIRIDGGVSFIWS